MKDLRADEMAQLPGGYYIRKEAKGGYRLRRFERTTNTIVDLKLYPGPGEAFEGYVDAFAQELVLQTEGVTPDNIGPAIEQMKELVRGRANGTAQEASGA